MKSKLLIALVLLALPGTADAGVSYYIGATLEIMCTLNLETRIGRDKCDGYLTAVADMGQGKLFCFPKRINSNDLTPIFLGYAAGASSAELGKPAPTVIINAFKQAFPCEGEQ